MSAISFWVYIWDYQVDVRFGSILGCLQIIFLRNHLAFPSRVNWIVQYKFIVWFNSLFDLREPRS